MSHLDVTETKVDQSGTHVGKTISRVPEPHPGCLFVRLIPQSCDRDKSRRNGGFGKTEEDSLDEDAGIVVADDSEEADETPYEDADGARLGEGVTRKDQSPRHDRDNVAVVILVVRSIQELPFSIRVYSQQQRR